MKPLYVLLAAAGHKPPPLVDIDWTVCIQFVIFIVLLVVLTRFVFKPWLALQKERDENIDGARTLAGELDREADEKIARYEDQVMSARKEAATVRAEYRKQAEARSGEVLGEARSASDAKISAARDKISKSALDARQALRTRADEIAKTIASKLLGREV